MKIALAILGIVLLIIGGVLFYESRNTVWTFETTPLRIPLPIVAGTTVQKSFTPGLTETYQVNLDFERAVVTPLTIGRFIDEMQSVDVVWSVAAGGKTVTSGESTSFPKNWYGSGPEQGWVIGKFPAHEGTTYLLLATVRNGPTDLNSAHPHIEVQVDTFRLTDYSYAEDFRLFFKQAGKIVAVVGVWLLIVAAILALIRR